ncbi:IS1380 family transposase [Nitrosomonas halophila]|uniref:Transposase DDE domain group 1 n=1 Tax=Nitrosomonas halophila TaxID=44576 RepID=A0A1H3N7D5_9PROT|nr:IS1380 family transposase [Nitrosomonas halophila]SDY84782.1 Transposase DDE domain group 1 [Nitrosomonas halophila]
MEFELRFTDKEITAWDGMGLMKRMLNRTGFDSAMEVCDLPQPGSNRGYSPTQLIVQFMLSVWCGANRFEHSEVTRHDPVLQKLFGFKRMANFKAIMRFFRKFDQATTMHVFGRLYRWFFGKLQLNHLTLDLDSTVMTRYGEQEGAARGYNPRKPGRYSHHPLMAFIADARMIANLWLRPGNSHSANNALAFLDDTLDKLGGKQVALLRADSGFSDAAFLNDLDQRSTHYLIALKLNQPLQNALVDQTGWWVLDEGIEVIAFDYQAPCWDKPRRIVGIRQKIDVRPDAKGKQLSLFADDPALACYRFGALVTDLDLSAEELWRQMSWYSILFHSNMPLVTNHWPTTL